MQVKRRHRVGLLTPSSNTTQEPEFTRVLPEGITLHTARLGFQRIDAETMMRSVEELERESRKLADADVDVIVFAATAPTSAKGKGYDRILIDRMQSASGKPATTASTALLEALARLGIRRVAIGAPWSESMNETMTAFLVDNGYPVVSRNALGLVANLELGRVDPETAYTFGCKADHPDAQAIVMPGGNWPTMSVIDRLERDLGKPVLTTNCVSIWAVLRMIGGYASVPGHGALLREHLG